MKKLIGNFKGDNLYLKISSYQNNNRIYIGIETEEELYADVTINLSNVMLLDDDYICVNSNMTTDLRKFLEKKQIIGETFTTIQNNMGRYDIAKVDFDLLKEYDPKGFNEYEKFNKLANKDMDVEL
jgi:hypothetical protein